MKATAVTDQESSEAKMDDIHGDVLAAISMALHDYQSEVHDVEEMVLTMDEVRRRYSPWSSKIYTLRQVPIRR